jgi:hypothetical protein
MIVQAVEVVINIFIQVEFTNFDEVRSNPDEAVVELVLEDQED